MPSIPIKKSEKPSDSLLMGLPTPEYFYLLHPLYEQIKIGEADWFAIERLIQTGRALDAFCVECGEHSVFKRSIKNSDTVVDGIDIDYGYSHQIFYCARENSHRLNFFILVAENGFIEKVGQNPSVADLNMHDVKKYASVLSRAYFNELKKAIGLAAHGVGVGSFVYLRRIFENLIEEAKAEAAKDDSFDLQTFSIARMNEKIKMLSGYLPPFLVENHQLYGILSKGVHELSEQECLDAFPVVKVGIELILDEHIVEKQRKAKIEESRKALAKLASKG